MEVDDGGCSEEGVKMEEDAPFSVLDAGTIVFPKIDDGGFPKMPFSVVPES